MPFAFWAIPLSLAAFLEVGGDAVIRRGLRAHDPTLVLLGFATVGAYGILVNLLRWDFARLMGVYVAFFACAGVLLGRILFRETIGMSTWCGLALIVLGGLIIQLGQR